MGKGTKVEESAYLTESELFNLYQEATLEVLRESKAEIAEKYKDKKEAAKKIKAKKLANDNVKKKKEALEGAIYSRGGVNSVLEQILDAR